MQSAFTNRSSQPSTARSGARSSKFRFEQLEDRLTPAASLWTDLLDYRPGATAYISGAGFEAGESIQLQVLHQDGNNSGAGHTPWIVTDGGEGDLDGQADGSFTASWYVNPDDSLDATFDATATGLSSGLFAATTFTDSNAGSVMTTDVNGAINGNTDYGSREDIYLWGKDFEANADYWVRVIQPGDGNPVLGSSITAAIHTNANGEFFGFHLWANVIKTSDGSQGFDWSVNGGGVYKVEVSSDSTYQHVKTDNFKVAHPVPPAASISGIKFEDFNGNGVRDDGDTGIGGVTIYIDANHSGSLDPDETSIVTDIDGSFSFTGLSAGTYNIQEILPAHWIQTLGVGEVTVADGEVVTGQDFGNFELFNVSGMKFYDQNTNGVNDDGKAIAGWTINLLVDANGNGIQDDGEVILSALTDSSGHYSFEDLGPLPNGAYLLSESITSLPGNWVQTAAPDETITAVSGVNYENEDYGNVQIGAGGGHTIGFWSNKNGQKLLTDADFDFLNSLNLRDNSGANKDFTGSLAQKKAALNTWLLNAKATNMAYMLSAQLVAMQLNVRHGFVDANALLYAPTLGSSNANGFITVSALMMEANALLATNSSGSNLVIDSSSPLRGYAGLLKTTLDDANNNLNFVVVW